MAGQRYHHHPPAETLQARCPLVAGAPLYTTAS